MRRKSREEKLAQGTYRADRDRKSPQYAPGAACPSYLSKEARQEWKRVHPMLEQAGVLQAIDQSLLASYCQMFGHWKKSEEDIAKNGLVIMVSSQTRTGRTEKPVQNPAVRNSIQFHKAMMATATKFGINPLDRPRIVPQDDDNDEQDLLQRFIDDGDDFGVTDSSTNPQ
jgi:P27 family predicted phage terminase small subunit